jgi:hypothetical protein
VRRLWDAEKFKLNSDGGDSGSKKYKRGYGGAYGGIWESVFCVGEFSRNLA